MLNHPQAVDLLAHLDRPDVHLLIRADHGHLITALQFHHGALGDQQRARLDAPLTAHAGELPRPEEVPRIGEEDGDLDRAGLDIHLPIGEGDPARLRVPAAVGQDQLDRPAGGVPPLPGAGQVLLLAHRDVDLDGIHAGHGGQLLGQAGSHQVAELRFRDPGDAGHRREDLGKAEIHPRLLGGGLIGGNGGALDRDLRLGGNDVGLGSGDRGVGGALGANGVVQLLAGHGPPPD